MRRSGALLLVLLYISFLQQTLAQANRLVSLSGKGDVAGVKSLIASGANPNAVDNTEIRGWTALMAAARAGNVAITDLLIQAHADLNATNQYGATALDVARNSGRTEVASLISAAGGKGRPEAAPAAAILSGIDRVKLAIAEPRIRSRLPDLQCVSEVAIVHQNYFRTGVYGGNVSITGEKVTIRLQQSGRTLAEGSWSTSFPLANPKTTRPNFLPADVSVDQLMKELLHHTVFNLEDLAELANSSIPEVRIGAAANLIDQLLLVKMASQDQDPRVRKVAVDKVTDQAVLSKVATIDNNGEVRSAAVEKVTDQTVLIRSATEDTDLTVRLASVRRLTDQTILAKIATEDREWSVRVAGIRNLTDQSVLAKVAIGDRNNVVRQAAVQRISDQKMLAKIAVEDVDWIVRLAAVNSLTDQAVLAKVSEEDNEPVVRKAALEKRIPHR